MYKAIFLALIMGAAASLPVSAQTPLRNDSFKEFQRLLAPPSDQQQPVRPQRRQEPLSGQPAVAPLAAPAPSPPNKMISCLAPDAFQEKVSPTLRGLPCKPANTLERLVMWNQIAMDTTAFDHAPPAKVGPAADEVLSLQQLGPHRSSRAMAIVHIAMFDAVNEVSSAAANPNSAAKRFASYSRGLPPISKPTSIDAAIAASAHRTLTYLYKGQESQLNYLLGEDLKLIAAPGKSEGVDFGVAVAEAIITIRHDDGARHLEPAVGEPGFPLNTAPGRWTPDPVSGLNVALGGRWSEVAPFAIPSAHSFRPPPPPSLGDEVYARDFKEVRRLGGDGSRTPTERTEDQTRAGLYWAYDGTAYLCAPPRLYNQIVRKIVFTNVLAGRAPKVVDYARLLALVNIAMGDAAISAWEAKYHYQYWRPVTGIRSGALDNRPDTEPDLTWAPLGAPATNGRGPNFTPPFPAYPSGHAVFGGAIFEVLRHFYRENTAFSFTSDEFNGMNSPAGEGMPARTVVTRNFSTFKDAERENADSRIYLGVHWRVDADAGIAQGNQVGRSVFDHALTCLDKEGASIACPLFKGLEDEPK